MNPELQRNLWIEAEPRRLIWAGVILALIFAAVWLVDRGRDAHDFVLAGGAVFAAAGLIWGPREARASVTHEVYARTWDFQRLSSLSPWAMTWGKLAGATSRTWVFAGVALLIAFLQLASITTPAHALYWAFTAVGLAVLMQASGMAVGLIEIRKARVAGRAPGLRSPGLFLLLLALLLASAAAWNYRHPRSMTISPDAIASAAPTVTWWGHPHDASIFFALSLVVFSAWGLAWAWRLMRLELQLQNAPIVWPPFVLFAGLYAAGFVPSAPAFGPGAAPQLACASFVFAACAYVGAFVDPADRVQARGFVASLRHGWTKGAPPQLSLIIAPVVLCAISALWTSVLYWRGGQVETAVFILALLAFLLRDLGLIAAIRFSPAGRGDVAALLALLLAYLAGCAFGGAFGGVRGAALFHPAFEHARASLLGGGLEAALLWAFAAWRISRPTRGRSRRVRT